MRYVIRTPRGYVAGPVGDRVDDVWNATTFATLEQAEEWAEDEKQFEKWCRIIKLELTQKTVV